MTIMRRGSRLLVVVGAMVVAMGLAWLASGSTFAEENSPLTFQGIIMDRQDERLIINERPLLLTRETRVLLKDKRPASDSLLVSGQWVVVVAEPATSGGQKIKTLYLVPGRLTGTDVLALTGDQSDE